MKALTLYAPFANALARGLKRYETRSWYTKHRGPLAVHASARVITDGVDDLWKLLPPPDRRTLGCVLGVVDLYHIFQMSTEVIKHISPEEKRWGHWEPGRHAWSCFPILLFPEPIPAKGHQGMWEWDAPTEIEDQVKKIMELRTGHREEHISSMYVEKLCPTCRRTWNALRFTPANAPCLACVNEAENRQMSLRGTN